MQDMQIEKGKVTWFDEGNRVSLKTMSSSEFSTCFANAAELLINPKTREVIAAGPNQNAIKRELGDHPELKGELTAFLSGPLDGISPAA